MHDPEPMAFESEFEFLQSPSGEIKACLSRENVFRLRQILIQCEYHGQ